MRSLRRARLPRLPGSVGPGIPGGPSSSGSAVSFRAEELQTIERRERIGILRVLTLGALLLAVAALLAWSAHGRIVAEGLVEANLVEIRAPGRVRIREVFCAPGQYFRRGEPLFTLEAIEGQGERRGLELDVQRADLRLQLAEAGGDLGEVNLDRRMGAAEDSEREWKLTEAALEVARADIEVLRRRRATLTASSALEMHRYSGEALAADERAGESEARAGRAEAERLLAEYQERTRGALVSTGAVSEHDRRVAEADQEKNAREAEAHRAASRALQAEAENLRAAGLLEGRVTGSELDELEAEIDSRTAEVEALRVERDLWRLATLRRRVLASEGPEGVARLRKLELELLRKEVESAATRLEAFDRRVGNGTVRAEADGVCDQLLVSPGTVAAADELLATHYDPRTRRVVAYVGPGAAEELSLGRACSVTPLRGDDSVWGQISASAAAWVPRPAAIPGRDEPSEDRRLAFRLGLHDVPAHYRPGMRVTVVFARSHDESASPGATYAELGGGFPELGDDETELGDGDTGSDLTGAGEE